MRLQIFEQSVSILRIWMKGRLTLAFHGDTRASSFLSIQTPNYPNKTNTSSRYYTYRSQQNLKRECVEIRHNAPWKQRTTDSLTCLNSLMTNIKRGKYSVKFIKTFFLQKIISYPSQGSFLFPHRFCRACPCRT